MKSFFVLLFLLPIINLLSQDTLLVSPEMVQVTVFNSKEQFIEEIHDEDDRYAFNGGSQIDYQVSVNLKKGEHLIVFKEIVNFSDYKIISDTALTIVSKRKVEGEIDIKPFEPLKKSLSEIDLMIQKIKSRISIYKSEREMILSNKTVEKSNSTALVDEIRKLGDFYRKRISDIDLQLYLDSLELIRLFETKSDRSSELKEKARKKNKLNKELWVQLIAPENREYNFKISLFEKTSTWDAEYDIKVKDVNSPLELNYRAIISQNTGIDWKNVKLILSSNQPDKKMDCPEIYPWKLDFFEQFKGYAVMVENVEDPGGVDPDRIIEEEVFKELTNSFEYHVPYKINISDGNIPKNINITTFNIPAKYKYLCIPKHDESVYLTALITDWEKYNFLVGEANLYLENVFVGNGFIHGGSVEDTLVFSLGVDERIQVKRSRVEEYSKAGFLSGKRTENVLWEITLKNNRKQNLSIELKDQLPLSKRKEIEVKQLDISGAEINPQTGILTWWVDIQPGNSVKKRINYTVTYPKDKKIVIE